MSLFSTDPSIVQFINQGTELTLKQWTRNILDILRDDWDSIIRCELDAQFTPENKNKILPLITKESNPLKQVVNATSMVYKEAATRTAEIDGKPDKRYEELMEEIPLNTIMRSVNKYARAVNQTLVKTTWRNGSLDYDILNFDNAVIYTDSKDWKKIIAVKYCIDSELPNFDDELKDSGITNTKGLKFEKFAHMFLWTIENDGKESYLREYKQTSEGNVIPIGGKQENPYRDENGEYVLPFTLFTKNYPDTDLLDFTTGTDAFDATINTAINMVHLNSLIKYQSYLIPVISASNSDAFNGNISLTPLDVLTIADPEGKTSVDSLDLQSRIDIVWDIIKERIMQIMSAYGIPPKAFSVSKSGQSGLSITLDRIDLTEQRQSDIELYRAAEKNLFEITRIVNNTHSNQKIDVKAKFKIDFGEISLPTSNEEQANARAINLSLNLSNPIEYIMEDNPDMSEKDATAQYEENIRINQGNETAQVSITAPQQPGNEPEEVVEDVEA